MQHEHTDNANQFEALFNHATLGMIVTNRNGIIVNANSYAEQQFGYTVQELQGKTVDMLVPYRFQHGHHRQRDVYYQHPAPRRMGEGRDLFAQRKDGTEFPVEISLSNYELQGQMFVIAFIIDITIRKKQEQLVLQQKAELEKITLEIKQLNSLLEEKVEARTNMLRETMSALEKSKEELSEALETEKQLGELKSRFVTMASHEFRTPLSTILSSTYLLEKYTQGEESGKTQKHIGRIKGAVSDMKNILEDFLSLGRLEEGLVTATMQVLTPEELFAEIQNAIHEMEQGLKKDQQVTFVKEGHASVEIDRHLLKNILNNLLSNAIKFSGEGAVIEVKTILQPRLFTLVVKDQGIGIAEDDMERLFGRFFRAKNAVNIQGTGLGLHIITKYLELMHGNIAVESKLNEGTSFTVHLPQKINALP
ncbi:sensor histidine kinase [Foetidibacter luteolus]|uniref:sensor histidine kinase n=1 Tax=Foetidibacter luteolus TaxID=2608880 RepID=UPI00129BA5FE|nr:PAS domain-containing sensor histidine kinase [Foetidibacter luteolus]